MEVIGAVFTRRGAFGDFEWMLEEPEFRDALFVFNDNESQFRAFRRDPRSPDGCAAGGGNAAIRPHRCTDPPRAAGIPTGDAGGYPRLDEHARAVIDEAIGVIGDLLATGRYSRVFYSASAEDPGLLGTGIFVVGDDVRRYIVAALHSLGSG